MNTKINEVKIQVTAMIFYVYMIHKENGVITHVYYYYGGDCKNRKCSVSDFYDMIIQCKCIAFAGAYYEDGGVKMFHNISLVVPCLKDGVKYLRTSNDDYKSNNLDNLPSD